MAAPPPAGIAGDEVHGGLGWQFDHSQRIAPVAANPVGLAIGPKSGRPSKGLVLLPQQAGPVPWHVLTLLFWGCRGQETGPPQTDILNCVGDFPCLVLTGVLQMPRGDD